MRIARGPFYLSTSIAFRICAGQCDHHALLLHAPAKLAMLHASPPLYTHQRTYVTSICKPQQMQWHRSNCVVNDLPVAIRLGTTLRHTLAATIA